MNGDTPVTEVLCQARHLAVDLQLAAIAEDTKESREGIGKALRLLTESNGSPSVIARLETCEACISAHVDESEKEKETRAKRMSEKAKTRLAVIGLVAGWVLSLLATFLPYLVHKPG